MKRLWNNLADRLWVLWGKVREADYRAMGSRVLNAIGKVMHKIFFDWLLPKKYRGITKREIYEIIFKADTPAGKRFDVWLLILIALNIVLLMVDSMVMGRATTLGLNSPALHWVLVVIEWGFTLAFTFEYYLRIYCLKHPWRYVLSLWGFIDFLSIFPAYLSLFIPATQALTALRLLRVLRIFRIFKLERFQDEAARLLDALRRSAIKVMVFMLFVLVAAIILGTIIYAIENEKNPAIRSIPQGIYWAVVTMTTVGYGDVVPVTAGGRFLSVIVMLLGYSIIAVPTGIVAGETINAHKRKAPKRRRSAVESEYDDEADARV
ncbi:MAG: ion transporter [Bacteroidales bacterium]|nr:ion transporter [Bacteroidales bacterium]